ncbi:MAG: MmcQ/YjbR family DNA-binding protein [Bacteroidia bacterium]|jgi:predicted DNA-binding protein (MmcQ/YjbR family)
MNVEEVREFALCLRATSEDFPFDEHTLVMRVGGKIFAILPLEKSGRINLKCDPERAVALREEFEAITPGYHMNKKWWNTVEFEKLPESLVKELITHSHFLVASALPKKRKAELGIE